MPASPDRSDRYGRELGRLEAWGAGYTRPRLHRGQPMPHLQPAPNQTRAGAQRPRRAAESGLRDGSTTSWSIIELAESGAVATILDRDRSEQYSLLARYVIAADGGRTVGRLLGVTMSGPRDVMKMVSVHMTADLTAWARDDDVLIRWLINPDFGGSFSGVLVPMGPDRWGPRSEEWVFHMQYAPDDLAGHAARQDPAANARNTGDS